MQWETIAAAKAKDRWERNAPGAWEYVADLRGRAGVVFGWSLEAGGAVDFAKAAEAFTRGAAIVDRLAMSGWGETIIVQSCLRRRGNGRGPEPRPG